MFHAKPRTEERKSTVEVHKKRQHPSPSGERASQPRRRSPSRILMGMVVSCMLSVTLLQLAMPIPESAMAAPLRRARSVIYVSDTPNLQLRSEDAGKIDQINYAFALIQDGQATGRHWNNVQRVTAFLKRNPHIDGLLSIGGWGADGFSQACATEEGRRKLADSLLALMDQHGFNGVDVDWEYPGFSTAGIASSAEDVENWYAFLALLRKGLDERTQATGRKHLLCVALGAGDALLQTIDAARLNELVDQAVVMAYDLAGFEKQTGHHAGLYPDAHRKDTGAYAINTLIAGGMDAQKLLLGIPAYGRVWRQVSGGGDGLHQRAATTGNRLLSFDDVLDLEKSGYKRYYDTDAQAAWWFDGSQFASAEDMESLVYKVDWAIDRGLLGTAVWSYEHDPSSRLLTTLHEAMLP